ncbi:hypothetical protein ACFRCI_23665 [Streptomyces sp. NPDC056638]|uniref:hypothetical protein n=1 Tax=Streptomyces sp. NPDC056638 TaxID=3345887 RepID=UPI0036BFE840
MNRSSKPGTALIPVESLIPGDVMCAKGDTLTVKAVTEDPDHVGYVLVDTDAGPVSFRKGRRVPVVPRTHTQEGVHHVR